MLNIIWALGSALIILLLISFLPLGFTFKGKFITVIASLLLALGGLASAATFPLWQTALMLAVLCFFIAYFMDNRIGTLIYNEDSIMEEVFEEKDETSDIEYHLDMVKSVDLVQVNEELVISDSSQVNIEKVLDMEVKQVEQLPELGKEMAENLEIIDDDISFFMGRNNEDVETEQLPKSDKKVSENLEIIDEDISFFMEKNTKDEAAEEMKESEPEIGYLSDIESLLEAVTEEKAHDVLEEIRNISQKDIQQQLPAQLEKEEEPLDDSLFDFLLATKEVASGRDDMLEEIKPKEKVSLQK